MSGGDLDAFLAAGVIDSAAAHFAKRVAAGESAPVALGAALAVQAVLNSNTCLDLQTAAELHGAPDASASQLTWPDPSEWRDALAKSPIVAPADAPSPVHIAENQPLVLDGSFLFLRRFHLDEASVATDLLARSAEQVGDVSSVLGELSALLPANDRDLENRPLAAATLAVSSNLTILTGGPGTGKTHTLSRIVAALWRIDPNLDIALAAPTGKAATRMRDAMAGAAEQLDESIADRVRAIEPSTLHRLLGLRPGEAPRYNRNNPLPHHVVIVDEASMISLPLMSDLLQAMQRRTKLVLVGDPYQLASVEAGSVLGDLVNEQSMLRKNVVELTVNYRSIASLDALFQSVNAGDADTAMDLIRASGRDGGPIDWIDLGPSGLGAGSGAATGSDDDSGDAIYAATDDLLRTTICDHARRLIAAAEANDLDTAHQLLADTKVLCATRRGPLGVQGWSERIEAQVIAKASRHTEWYDGRPVMVTRNDYITGLLNGDTGITIDGGTRVSFPEGDNELFGTEQLSDIETWWAMTIHKSQGSEFRHAIVCIDGESRLSSRELLYTALTRAKQRVTIVASEASIRSTIERRANRTSGLRNRLTP